ncbi:MAG: ribose 5-phosphate isomerase B [Candidatus Melainabacteria bacterium]|nr:MAG: ribose 5-phosphate isomerase B [Candidatus Melainabacteria bacterium]RAI13590.1 MAG: ribose 5-phosphate isomerase B [Candidatus Melainabacteria bacterium]
MNIKKIGVGSDHAGVNLKNKIAEFLKEKGYEVTDYGTNSTASCDYPVYAKAVAKSVANGENERGIICCGSGIGVSIAANKVKGVRAVLAHEPYSAMLSRLHNDANVLCLGERITGESLALDIVETWLHSEYEGGRHQRRVDMLDAE